MHVVDFIVNDASMHVSFFNCAYVLFKCHNFVFNAMTDFSLMTYAGLMSPCAIRVIVNMNDFSSHIYNWETLRSF